MNKVRRQLRLLSWEDHNSGTDYTGSDQLANLRDIYYRPSSSLWIHWRHRSSCTWAWKYDSHYLGFLAHSSLRSGCCCHRLSPRPTPQSSEFCLVFWSIFCRLRVQHIYGNTSSGRKSKRTEPVRRLNRIHYFGWHILVMNLRVTNVINYDVIHCSMQLLG